jgi:hypothetical protein
VAPVDGINYYRLKSMNVDGSSTYSKIAVVAFTKETSLQLFPNPAHDMLTIKNVFTNATIYLYDLNGKQVLVKKLAANNSNSSGASIALSGLPNGVYMIKLYADGKIIQGSVVKE